MSTHKSSDYKLTAVKYFLDNNVSQLDTCKIFNCNPRSLMRWVNKYKITNTIKRKTPKIQYFHFITIYHNKIKIF